VTAWPFAGSGNLKGNCMSTITIACNLPHGIHLQRYQFKDKHDGIVAFRAAEALGDRVTLNGANHESAIMGFGITENVDAEWFAAWLEENQDIAFVKNGSIVAHAKAAHVEGAVKEKKGKQKTGFEKIDPNSHGVEKADKK